MINVHTGEIIFDGVEIRKNMKIADFLQYDKSRILINDRGNGRGIIKLTNAVMSNGVYAQVKIEINEKMSVLRINILPSLKENAESDLLSASKTWLEGMISTNEIEVNEKAINRTYSWGHISAQHIPDRDYGTVGGDINIVYEEN